MESVSNDNKDNSGETFLQKRKLNRLVFGPEILFVPQSPEAAVSGAGTDGIVNSTSTVQSIQVWAHAVESSSFLAESVAVLPALKQELAKSVPQVGGSGNALIVVTTMQNASAELSAYTDAAEQEKDRLLLSVSAATVHYNCTAYLYLTTYVKL